MQPKCKPAARVAVNAASAIPVVEEFLALVVQLDEMYDPYSAYLATNDYKTTKMAVDRSVGPIRLLIEATDDSLMQKLDRGLGGNYGYSAAVSAVSELLGLLEFEATSATIMGPTGPRPSVSRMHPWVLKAAGSLWEGGHHAQAVQTAASSVFDQELPAKLGLTPGARGTKPEEMVGKAFDETAPVLKIPGFTQGTQNRTNVYQGSKHLGLACAKLVRNIGTHTVASGGDPDVLIEELAMLSRFARIVEASTV
jgi:hypothetical protein